jgi:hypothetical protein
MSLRSSWRWLPSVPLAALVLLCVSSPRAGAQPVLTVKKDANLRPDPSTTYQPFALLAPDTSVTLLEPEPVDGYYHVLGADGLEGWVWNHNITAPFAHLAPGARGAALTAAFAVGAHPECLGVLTLSACDETRGCALPGTSKARLNGLKNTFPATGSPPATLKHATFRALQAAVDVAPPVPTGRNAVVSQAVRDSRLRNIDVGAATFSEGDYVQLAGYIARWKKPAENKPRKLEFATAESVNCHLEDPSSNDIHIPIVSGKTKASHHEHTSVTVEPIPRERSEEWTLARFQHVQAKQLKVLVRGQLLFDNSHKPNPDPASTSSEPKRISSWEIHPVTEFLVCTAAASQCDPDTSSVWKPLEDIVVPED